MNKSMFSSEISSKIEQESNRFVACRALSIRARAVNSERSPEEEEGISPSAQAMSDYSEGRILIVAENGEAEA